jgi:hypothetical protein
MAIQTTSVSEQLKKLNEEADKIKAEADAKLASLQAQKAELQEAARAEQYAKLYAVLDDIKGIGEQVWDIGNRAVAHLGLPVLRQDKKTSKPQVARVEGAKRTRNKNPDRECPICQFKTVPPHDARRHRGQKEKLPFSVKELEAMGMEKV